MQEVVEREKLEEKLKMTQAVLDKAHAEALLANTALRAAKDKCRKYAPRTKIWRNMMIRCRPAARGNPYDEKIAEKTVRTARQRWHDALGAQSHADLANRVARDILNIHMAFSKLGETLRDEGDGWSGGRMVGACPLRDEGVGWFTAWRRLAHDLLGRD